VRFVGSAINVSSDNQMGSNMRFQKFCEKSLSRKIKANSLMALVPSCRLFFNRFAPQGNLYQSPNLVKLTSTLVQVQHKKTSFEEYFHLENKNINFYCSQSIPWVSEGVFPGGSKVVKFVFSHPKHKKTTFFAENFKIQGGQGPLLSPFRHPRSLLSILFPRHLIISNTFEQNANLRSLIFPHTVCNK